MTKFKQAYTDAVADVYQPKSLGYRTPKDLTPIDAFLRIKIKKQRTFLGEKTPAAAATGHEVVRISRYIPDLAPDPYK